MESFTPSKKSLQDFNNGVKYVDFDPTIGQNGDEVQADTINNLIESQMWVQALAQNSVDNSEANKVGNAEIVLAYKPDGTPYLKTKSLKGETGRGVLSFRTAIAESINNETRTTVVVTFTDNTTQTMTIYAKNGADGTTPSLDDYATKAYVDNAIANVITTALNANYGG